MNKKIYVIGLVLISLILFSDLSKAQVIGINSRLDEISSLGIFGIKNDIDSINWNPANLLLILPDENFIVNGGLGSINNKITYKGNILINPSFIRVPILCGIEESSYENSEGSIIKNRNYQITSALTDPVAGTSLIGGVSVKYLYFEEENDNNKVNGNALLVDIGFLKRVGKWIIESVWHNGSYIKWELDTVLENEIPSSFNLTIGYTLKDFHFLIGWIHIFPTHYFPSINSTKGLILKEAEERFIISLIIKPVNHLFVQFNLNNSNFDLINYDDKINNIFLNISTQYIYKNYIFNIRYIDNSVSIKNSINLYRKIYSAISYKFNL